MYMRREQNITSSNDTTTTGGVQNIKLYAVTNAN